ncbi:MAG: hypothetical protein LBP39_00490 [Rickettsiales bacterium]|jgi:hypothetical protein|nr:hypothetical protein [Rickettsiales bacterium]
MTKKARVKKSASGKQTTVMPEEENFETDDKPTVFLLTLEKIEDLLSLPGAIENRGTEEHIKDIEAYLKTEETINFLLENMGAADGTLAQKKIEKMEYLARENPKIIASVFNGLEKGCSIRSRCSGAIEGKAEIWGKKHIRALEKIVGTNLNGMEDYRLLESIRAIVAREAVDRASSKDLLEKISKANLKILKSLLAGYSVIINDGHLVEVELFLNFILALARTNSLDDGGICEAVGNYFKLMKAILFVLENNWAVESDIVLGKIDQLRTIQSKLQRSSFLKTLMPSTLTILRDSYRIRLKNLKNKGELLLLGSKIDYLETLGHTIEKEDYDYRCELEVIRNLIHLIASLECRVEENTKFLLLRAKNYPEKVEKEFDKLATIYRRTASLADSESAEKISREIESMEKLKNNVIPLAKMLAKFDSGELELMLGVKKQLFDGLDYLIDKKLTAKMEELEQKIKTIGLLESLIGDYDYVFELLELVFGELWEEYCRRFQELDTKSKNSWDLYLFNEKKISEYINELETNLKNYLTYRSYLENYREKMEILKKLHEFKAERAMTSKNREPMTYIVEKFLEKKDLVESALDFEVSRLDIYGHWKENHSEYDAANELYRSREFTGLLKDNLQIMADFLRDVKDKKERDDKIYNFLLQWDCMTLSIGIVVETIDDNSIFFFTKSEYFYKLANGCFDENHRRILLSAFSEVKINNKLYAPKAEYKSRRALARVEALESKIRTMDRDKFLECLDEYIALDQMLSILKNREENSHRIPAILHLIENREKYPNVFFMLRGLADSEKILKKIKELETFIVKVTDDAGNPGENERDWLGRLYGLHFAQSDIENTLYSMASDILSLGEESVNSRKEYFRSILHIVEKYRCSSLLPSALEKTRVKITGEIKGYGAKNYHLLNLEKYLSEEQTITKLFNNLTEENLSEYETRQSILGGVAFALKNWNEPDNLGRATYETGIILEILKNPTAVEELFNDYQNFYNYLVRLTDEYSLREKEIIWLSSPDNLESLREEVFSIAEKIKTTPSECEKILEANALLWNEETVSQTIELFLELADNSYFRGDESNAPYTVDFNIARVKFFGQICKYGRKDNITRAIEKSKMELENKIKEAFCDNLTSTIKYALRIVELEELQNALEDLDSFDRRYISAKQIEYLLTSLTNFAGFNCLATFYSADVICVNEIFFDLVSLAKTRGIEEIDGVIDNINKKFRKAQKKYARILSDWCRTRTGMMSAVRSNVEKVLNYIGGANDEKFELQSYRISEVIKVIETFLRSSDEPFPRVTNAKEGLLERLLKITKINGSEIIDLAFDIVATEYENAFFRHLELGQKQEKYNYIEKLEGVRKIYESRLQRITI